MSLLKASLLCTSLLMANTAIAVQNQPTTVAKGINTIARQQAYDNAKQPKELMIIPGASHFDLYDKPQFVNPAVDKLTAFFGKNL